MNTVIFYFFGADLTATFFTFIHSFFSTRSSQGEEFTLSMDPFQGLRETAHSPQDISKVHQTLVNDYLVDEKIARLVLDPSNTEEFYRFYCKEVQKLFNHLSRISRRSVKVRVDPHRSLQGYEVFQAASKSTAKDDTLTPEEDPAWYANLSTIGKQLRDRELVERMRAQTPSDANRDMTPESQRGLASAQTLLDSSVRIHKHSFLFSTPPEFKGFTVDADIS